ncbi:endonuclease III domain-containing protein [Sedimenticola selenatireducens]|uniref:Endonuclease III domain-containing protein n=1 Tax=Sedimenticola selenatireducens TaxID=191960 RepID=A0A557S7Q5_9GAMM|nr:endonuclease III domain-containing protein [Sedimenticola selenatireducens]TVO73456.1 endonuclease III domain-containing protein [Sedimenticola selenatireducens]TVT63397.1 MAG: endonuclease III domain-containing protein [Sedimenticola selenatireducens]
MTVNGSLAEADLRNIYDRLLAEYGPQQWWPGETSFEVMVGAVLTQNTAWPNVERAIQNLKQAGILSPQAIDHSPQTALADLLRPSGYFNVKAVRLKNLCKWVLELGLEEGRDLSTDSLRSTLLAVNGIGPETADDILLYAYDRPVFVIDAYTRRIFSRIGLVSGNESYETLRAQFERELGASAAIYNEYHALIVYHAKYACRVKPRCDQCIIKLHCQFSKK